MSTELKEPKVKYLLKLYVSESSVSVKTIETLKQALKGTGYKIIMVDINKQPEEAEKDNILVVPTLIKELPEPVKRLVGELADKEKILASLDIIKEN